MVFLKDGVPLIKIIIIIFLFKSALSEQNASVSVSGGEQIIYNILNISRYRNTDAEVTFSFFLGGSQQC